MCRGLCAVVCAGFFVCAMLVDNGPFRRPHPFFWRGVFSLSLIYLAILIYVCFQVGICCSTKGFMLALQTRDTARELLSILDSRLGKPLAEKSYGGNCHLYDSDNPADPWHNVRRTLKDEFVAVHFFGFWAKVRESEVETKRRDNIQTLITRDAWMCLMQSVLFELVEYSLEHQLPNFQARFVCTVINR